MNSYAISNPYETSPYNTVYAAAKAKGYDPCYATFMAEQWQARCDREVSRGRRAEYTPRPLDAATAPRCAKMCAKCAFKKGSPERKDEYGFAHLIDGWENGVAFYCHESVPNHYQEVRDGTPRWRLCAGYLAHIEKLESKNAKKNTAQAN